VNVPGNADSPSLDNAVRSAQQKEISNVTIRGLVLKITKLHNCMVHDGDNAECKYYVDYGDNDGFSW